MRSKTKPNPFGYGIEGKPAVKVDTYVQDLIDRINEFIDQDGNRTFNTNWFDSVYEQWAKWGKLSDKQIEGLENIIERWNIE